MTFALRKDLTGNIASCFLNRCKERESKTTGNVPFQRGQEAAMEVLLDQELFVSPKRCTTHRGFAQARVMPSKRLILFLWMSILAATAHNGPSSHVFYDRKQHVGDKLERPVSVNAKCYTKLRCDLSAEKCAMLLKQLSLTLSVGHTVPVRKPMGEHRLDEGTLGLPMTSSHG